MWGVTETNAMVQVKVTGQVVVPPKKGPDRVSSLEAAVGNGSQRSPTIKGP